VTAPTLIQYAESVWTGAGTATKAVSGLTWQTGDVLVAFCGNSNSQSNFSTAPTVGGGSFTFTAIAGCAQSATGTECATNAWVGTAPSGGSGLSVTFTGNAGDDWGCAVWIWRGSGGIGNVAVGVTSALTTSLTRSGANSCVVGGAFDWGAGATTGYGWTPAATNDRQHAQDGTQYTVFVADWGDQGSTGTTNYGVTGFTTSSPFSKVFIEVLGVAGSASSGPIAGIAQPGPAWLARFKGQYRKPQIPFPPPFAPPVAVVFPPPFIRPALTQRRATLRRSQGQFFNPGQFNEAATQVPSFTEQAGSRPRYGPRISRGRFFNPGWGQGNQGVQFPLFTRQAQSRRLTLRRSEGNFFSPGQWNEVAPVLPSFPRQRQRNILRRSQGQFFTQAWGQGNQGTQFPLFLRQSYSQRLTLRRSKGNFFSPGQFNNTAPALPNFTRQAAGRKLALRRSQGVFFNQSWGQGNQGTNFPSFMDPAGYRPRWAPRISRGRFSVVFSGPAAIPPPQFITRQERPFPARAPRGRFQVPGLGQGNQGVTFPLYMRQAESRRLTLRRSQGKFTGVPSSFVAPAIPQFIRGTYNARLLARPPRGSFSGQVWPQGNQGVKFPLFQRATSRPVPAKVIRGKFWAPGQFNETAPQLPSFTRTAKRPSLPARHGTYFQVYTQTALPAVPQLLSPRRPKLSPPRRGNVFRWVPPPAVIPVFPPEFKTTRRQNFTWMRRRVIVQLVPFQIPATADIKFRLGGPQFEWTAGNAKTNWRIP
jgi:hypothetical protein